MPGGTTVVIGRQPASRVTVVEQTATVDVTSPSNVTVDVSAASVASLNVAPPSNVSVGVSDGVPGPQGDPGVVEEHTHTQTTASASWAVAHNLGKRPIVTVLSPGGMEVEASVTHIDTNNVTVSFSVPLTGSVRCI